MAFKSENRQVIEKYLFDNDLYDLDIDNDYDIMGIIDDIDNLKYLQDISFRTNYLAQYSIESSDQYIEEFYVF